VSVPAFVHRIDVDFATTELARIVTKHSSIEVIADDLSFGEGPVWNARLGYLNWVDIVASSIWRWRPATGREIHLHPTGHANGLTIDSLGRLVVAGWGSRRIWRLNSDGSTETLATHFQGKRLNGPNDLVVKSDGSIYWSDPSGALFIPGMGGEAGEDLQRYLDNHSVYTLRSNSSDVIEVADNCTYPNGLCFAPDETYLYVADTHQANVRRFAVLEDGTLGESEVFYSLVGDEPGVADGTKVDSEGNVYVTGPAGIHVISPEGKLLGRLRIPGHVTNLAWGDDNWKSLFVTTISSLYQLHLGISGQPVG